STAHMRIVPALFGWQDPGSAFSAAMQLAALAAVVSYFWRDVRNLAVHSGYALLRARFDDPYFRLARAIWLATVPTGLAALGACGGAQRLQFAVACAERHRLGVPRHGAGAGTGGVVRPAQAHHRTSLAARRATGRHRASGRADPGRLAFGFDADGRAGARLRT